MFGSKLGRWVAKIGQYMSQKRESCERFTVHREGLPQYAAHNLRKLLQGVLI
jgi:hypothetical protein